MLVQKTLFDSHCIGDGRKVRLIELFAGIGAQAKALKNIGVEFEHHVVVEWDKFAIQSYNAIHGTSFEPSDIRDIHSADLRIEDQEKYCYVLTYSFPCQDLSVAGRCAGFKKDSGTRSGLLWEVGRLLNECAAEGHLPDVLLMENVPQIHNKKNLSVFRKWIRDLAQIGYTTQYKDLNAQGFGVPQHRIRTFAVSTRNNNVFSFPDEMKCPSNILSILDTKENRNDKYIIKTQRAEAFVANLIRENPEIFSKAENGCFVDFSICQGRHGRKTVVRQKQGIREAGFGHLAESDFHRPADIQKTSWVHKGILLRKKNAVDACERVIRQTGLESHLNLF